MTPIIGIVAAQNYPRTISINYLGVAGGGGGGGGANASDNRAGGAGGAGGFRTNSATVAPGTSSSSLCSIKTNFLNLIHQCKNRFHKAHF